MSEKETILVKIKKLIDKANSTDSIHEKETFMLKAQQLLREHNLEMSHVDRLNSKEDASITRLMMQYEFDWEVELASHIAQYNFGKVTFGSHTKRISIYAKEDNANVIQYLFSFFKNTLMELSLTSYNKMLEDAVADLVKSGIRVDRKAYEKTFKKTKKNTYIQDYLIGGVAGIADKMYADEEEAKKNTSNLTGLILHNAAAIDKFISENVGPLRYSGLDMKVGSSGGYNDGVRDGKNISVRKGVN